MAVVSLPLQLPKLHRCNPPAGFVKFSHRPYVTSIRKSFCPRRPMVAAKANEVLKEDLISQSRIGLRIHTFHNVTPYAEFYEFSRIFLSFLLSVTAIIAIEIFQRSRCTYCVLGRVFSIARSLAKITSAGAREPEFSQIRYYCVVLLHERGHEGTC